jgi:hypothetical protein
MRTSIVPPCGAQSPPHVVVIGNQKGGANPHLPCTSLWPYLKPESASFQRASQILIGLMSDELSASRTYMDAARRLSACISLTFIKTDALHSAENRSLSFILTLIVVLSRKRVSV